MVKTLSEHRHGLFYRLVSAFVLVAFLTTSVAAYAQSPSALPYMPPPTELLATSSHLNIPLLKGIRFSEDNLLNFNFIIEDGKEQTSDDAFQEEASKIIKYFLASLTIPDEDLWVNLSPYEKDKIIPHELGQTEMGKDMLGEDYILKQLVASLTYPEGPLGKQFWTKVYQRAFQLFKTTKIPINTFNKVWIVPDKAVVYEDNDRAFIGEATLKVMLEEDYLAMKNNTKSSRFKTDTIKEEQVKDINNLSSVIMKEVVLPVLQEEINYGKNFALLRQMYSSLILATWFKKKLKETIFEKVYINKKKIRGVDVDDIQIKEKIYAQYVEAYRKGVYDYVKKDSELGVQSNYKRRYFSGGMKLNASSALQTRKINDNPRFSQQLARSLLRNVSAMLSKATETGKSILNYVYDKVSPVVSSIGLKKTFATILLTTVFMGVPLFSSPAQAGDLDRQNTMIEYQAQYSMWNPGGNPYQHVDPGVFNAPKGEFRSAVYSTNDRTLITAYEQVSDADATEVGIPTIDVDSFDEGQITVKRGPSQKVKITQGKVNKVLEEVGKKTIREDGIMGRETRKGVKDVQRILGVDDDGVWGSITEAKFQADQAAAKVKAEIEAAKKQVEEAAAVKAKVESVRVAVHNLAEPGTFGGDADKIIGDIESVAPEAAVQLRNDVKATQEKINKIKAVSNFDQLDQFLAEGVQLPPVLQKAASDRKAELGKEMESQAIAAVQSGDLDAARDLKVKLDQRGFDTKTLGVAIDKAQEAKDVLEKAKKAEEEQEKQSPSLSLGANILALLIAVGAIAWHLARRPAVRKENEALDKAKSEAEFIEMLKERDFQQAEAMLDELIGLFGEDSEIVKQFQDKLDKAIEDAISQINGENNINVLQSFNDKDDSLNRISQAVTNRLDQLRKEAEAKRQKAAQREAEVMAAFEAIRIANESEEEATLRADREAAQEAVYRALSTVAESGMSVAIMRAVAEQEQQREELKNVGHVSAPNWIESYFEVHPVSEARHRPAWDEYTQTMRVQEAWIDRYNSVRDELEAAQRESEVMDAFEAIRLANEIEEKAIALAEQGYVNAIILSLSMQGVEENETRAASLKAIAEAERDEAARKIIKSFNRYIRGVHEQNSQSKFEAAQRKLMELALLGFTSAVLNEKLSAAEVYLKSPEARAAQISALEGYAELAVRVKEALEAIAAANSEGELSGYINDTDQGVREAAVAKRQELVAKAEEARKAEADRVTKALEAIKVAATPDELAGYLMDLNERIRDAAREQVRKFAEAEQKKAGERTERFLFALKAENFERAYQIIAEVGDTTEQGREFRQQLTQGVTLAIERINTIQDTQELKKLQDKYSKSMGFKDKERLLAAINAQLQSLETKRLAIVEQARAEVSVEGDKADREAKKANIALKEAEAAYQEAVEAKTMEEAAAAVRKTEVAAKTIAGIIRDITDALSKAEEAAQKMDIDPESNEIIANIKKAKSNAEKVRETVQQLAVKASKTRVYMFSVAITRMERMLQAFKVEIENPNGEAAKRNSASFKMSYDKLVQEIEIVRTTLSSDSQIKKLNALLKNVKKLPRLRNAIFNQDKKNQQYLDILGRAITELNTLFKLSGSVEGQVKANDNKIMDQESTSWIRDINWKFIGYTAVAFIIVAAAFGGYSRYFADRAPPAPATTLAEEVENPQRKLDEIKRQHIKDVKELIAAAFEKGGDESLNQIIPELINQLKRSGVSDTEIQSLNTRLAQALATLAEQTKQKIESQKKQEAVKKIRAFLDAAFKEGGEKNFNQIIPDLIVQLEESNANPMEIKSFKARLAEAKAKLSDQERQSQQRLQEQERSQFEKLIADANKAINEKKLDVARKILSGLEKTYESKKEYEKDVIKLRKAIVDASAQEASNQIKAAQEPIIALIQAGKFDEAGKAIGAFEEKYGEKAAESVKASLAEAKAKFAEQKEQERKKEQSQPHTYKVTANADAYTVHVESEGVGNAVRVRVVHDKAKMAVFSISKEFASKADVRFGDIQVQPWLNDYLIATDTAKAVNYYIIPYKTGDNQVGSFVFTAPIADAEKINKAFKDGSYVALQGNDGAGRNNVGVFNVAKRKLEDSGAIQSVWGPYGAFTDYLKGHVFELEYLLTRNNTGVLIRLTDKGFETQFYVVQSDKSVKVLREDGKLYDPPAYISVKPGVDEPRDSNRDKEQHYINIAAHIEKADSWPLRELVNNQRLEKEVRTLAQEGLTDIDKKNQEKARKHFYALKAAKDFFESTMRDFELYQDVKFYLEHRQKHLFAIDDADAENIQLQNKELAKMIQEARAAYFAAKNAAEKIKPQQEDQTITENLKGALRESGAPEKTVDTAVKAFLQGKSLYIPVSVGTVHSTVQDILASYIKNKNRRVIEDNGRFFVRGYAGDKDYEIFTLEGSTLNAKNGLGLYLKFVAGKVRQGVAFRLNGKLMFIGPQMLEEISDAVDITTQQSVSTQAVPVAQPQIRAPVIRTTKAGNTVEFVFQAGESGPKLVIKLNNKELTGVPFDDKNDVLDLGKANTIQVGVTGEIPWVQDNNARIYFSPKDGSQTVIARDKVADFERRMVTENPSPTQPVVAQPHVEPEPPMSFDEWIKLSTLNNSYKIFSYDKIPGVFLAEFLNAEIDQAAIANVVKVVEYIGFKNAERMSPQEFRNKLGVLKTGDAHDLRSTDIARAYNLLKDKGYVLTSDETAFLNTLIDQGIIRFGSDGRYFAAEKPTALITASQDLAKKIAGYSIFRLWAIVHEFDHAVFFVNAQYRDALVNAYKSMRLRDAEKKLILEMIGTNQNFDDPDNLDFLVTEIFAYAKNPDLLRWRDQIQGKTHSQDYWNLVDKLNRLGHSVQPTELAAIYTAAKNPEVTKFFTNGAPVSKSLSSKAPVETESVVVPAEKGVSMSAEFGTLNVLSVDDLVSRYSGLPPLGNEEMQVMLSHLHKENRTRARAEVLKDSFVGFWIWHALRVTNSPDKVLNIFSDDNKVWTKSLDELMGFVTAISIQESGQDYAKDGENGGGFNQLTTAALDQLVISYGVNLKRTRMKNLRENSLAMSLYVLYLAQTRNSFKDIALDYNGHPQHKYHYSNTVGVTLRKTASFDQRLNARLSVFGIVVDDTVRVQIKQLLGAVSIAEVSNEQLLNIVRQASEGSMDRVVSAIRDLEEGLEKKDEEEKAHIAQFEGLIESLRNNPGDLKEAESQLKKLIAQVGESIDQKKTFSKAALKQIADLKKTIPRKVVSVGSDKVREEYAFDAPEATKLAGLEGSINTLLAGVDSKKKNMTEGMKKLAYNLMKELKDLSRKQQQKRTENTITEQPAGVAASSAMENTGGIDFNAQNMNLEIKGSGLNINATDIPIDLKNFEGFTFQIIKIERVEDVNTIINAEHASDQPVVLSSAK